MNAKAYYVVKNGYKVGIYTSWNDAKEQIHGYSNGIIKKFSNLFDAKSFFQGNLPETSTHLQSNASIKPSNTSLTNNNSNSYCYCNSLCILRIVKKESIHKGREFYTCPTSSCKFFAWKDNSINQMNNTSTSDSSSSNANISCSIGYIIYTDGACSGNKHVAQFHNPAGWACVILQERNQILHQLEELYGPVIVNEKDKGYLGAQVSSNNTAELSAIGYALEWLCENINGEDKRKTHYIRYDSEYAASSITGKFNGAKNRLLIDNIRKIYHNLIKDLKVKIVFEHVKGHSNDTYNDRADKLAKDGCLQVEMIKKCILIDNNMNSHVSKKMKLDIIDLT